VDIDLAAVLADDLDLVVSLFVADLSACNLTPVGIVEGDALSLLDAGSVACGSEESSPEPLA
jgi:hypothetical protein